METNTIRQLCQSKNRTIEIKRSELEGTSMSVINYYLSEKVKVIVENEPEGYQIKLAAYPHLEVIGVYKTLAEALSVINRDFGNLIVSSAITEISLPDKKI